VISGLYLSATGVLINSYRQDVIANNIANAETVGFKRDLALFQQRPTETQERGGPQSETNQLLESLGGGILASPTSVDDSQGELEPGGLFDVGIQGKGFFAVSDPAGQRITRDGRFAVNSIGHLVLAGNGRDVLSDAGKPIQVDPTQPVQLRSSGAVYQNGVAVDRIGLFDVADRSKLRKEGGTLLSIGDSTLQPGSGEMHPGFTERANVDPTTELTQLMDAQRQLEANANMIRYQDETLNRLVNDVGKVT
jgi:flagellar basal-body rod protein FlgF